MKRIAIGLVVPLAFLLIPAGAGAEWTVELDLDGYLGNGPDYIFAYVSDYVTADLWIHGDEPMIAFSVDLCNWDGALEFQGAEYLLPVEWEGVIPEPGVCVSFSAFDTTPTGTEEESWGGIKSRFRNGRSIPFKSAPSRDPITLPAHVGRIVYHAAVDYSLADIIPNSGSWTTVGGATGEFSNYIGGTVQIGMKSPDKSAWGAIRGLFR